MCGPVLCEGCGSPDVVTTRADMPVCATCADNNDKYTLEGNVSEQQALTLAMSELSDLGVRWGDRAYNREQGGHIPTKECGTYLGDILRAGRELEGNPRCFCSEGESHAHT